MYLYTFPPLSLIINEILFADYMVLTPYLLLINIEIGDDCNYIKIRKAFSKWKLEFIIYKVILNTNFIIFITFLPRICLFQILGLKNMQLHLMDAL